MTTKYNIGDEIIYHNTDTCTEMVIDDITITKNCTEDKVRKIFDEEDFFNDCMMLDL